MKFKSNPTIAQEPPVTKKSAPPCSICRNFASQAAFICAASSMSKIFSAATPSAVKRPLTLRTSSAYHRQSGSRFKISLTAEKSIRATFCPPIANEPPSDFSCTTATRFTSSKFNFRAASSKNFLLKATSTAFTFSTAIPPKLFQKRFNLILAKCTIRTKFFQLAPPTDALPSHTFCDLKAIFDVDLKLFSECVRLGAL